MEQILVYKKGGQTLSLYSYTSNSGVTRAEQTLELMGQDVVTVTMISAQVINFELGDYLEVFGGKYTINTLPAVYKRSDRAFEYDIRFEGVQYELIKAQFLDVDAAGASTGTSFFFTGNINDFAQMIIRNMERVHGAGTWTIGVLDGGAESKNMQFDNVTCMQALINICEQYDQEYDIERLGPTAYRLNIRKNKGVISQQFRYGRVRGLYELRRQTVSNQNIVTRLFAYGASKNILASYRGGATRLKMPLQFIHSEGAPYIQSLAYIAQYGLIEGVVNFDDIYPHRVGKVTSLVPNDPLGFADSSMSFDLGASANGNTLYLIPGLDAKITFKTGDLAGYEFTLSSYTHAQRTFRINKYTDPRGAEFPSSPAFTINIGDEYVITDINMPQAYIDAAEQELYERAAAYLVENSKPKVQYELELDEFYVARISEEAIASLTNTVSTPAASQYLSLPVFAGVTAVQTLASRVNGGIMNYFLPGDSIPVKDADLNIDDNIQVTAVTRDLLRHYRFKLTLGESYAKRVAAGRRRRNSATATSTAVSNNGSAIAAATSVSNNSTTIGSLSSSMLVMKQAQSGTSNTGTWTMEITVTSSNSSTDPGTGETKLSEYQLRGKRILLILRGNVPETNYLQDSDWNLYFKDGLSEGEVLKVLYTT